MESFKYRNKEIEFHPFHGAPLIKLEKSSETVISSSGGGGHLQNGTGHVSAAQVSSRTINWQELWFKDKNNIDTSFKVATDLPMLEGHVITLISARLKDESEYFGVCILINQSTKRHAIVKSGNSINNQAKFATKTASKALLATAIISFIIFVLGAMMDSASFGAIIAGLCSPIVLWNSFSVYERKVKKVEGLIDAHLDMLAEQSTFKN